jgi:hypothetical protein
VPPELAPLANLGAVGLILGYVLWQISPRLERIERAIDLNSRALLLDIVSRSDTSDVMKAQAQSMIRTIEMRHGLKQQGADL